MTLYAIDHEHRELYSRLLAPGPIPEVREIRVPISEKSIAGFVALARRPGHARAAAEGGARVGPCGGKTVGGLLPLAPGVVTAVPASEAPELTGTASWASTTFT